jgi:hypothetical protein
VNRVDERERFGGDRRPPPIPSHPTIDDYERAAAHFRAATDKAGEFGHLLELALVGARLGTIRPAEIVRRVQPAAVAVTLLMEPGIAAVGEAVARAILRGGAGPQYWARMVREVDTTRSSLASLMRDKADPGAGHRVLALRARRSARFALSGLDLSGQRWRAANVLLAVAPPLAARAVLASGATVHKEPTEAELKAMREQAALILEMASQAPLCRELVEHAFGSLGDTALRLRLAENAFTPDSVLARLVADHDTEPEVTHAVQIHEFAAGTVRRLAFQAVRDEPDEVVRGLRRLLELRGEAAFLEMLEAAPQQEAAWVRSMVRYAGPELGPEARLAAYVRLAEMTAAEVVWAVELARAGTLEQMMPAVRASMAEGTAAPLIAAHRENTAKPQRRITEKHDPGDHFDRWLGGSRRAERYRAAVAEIQRWRTDAALNDPIPLA